MAPNGVLDKIVEWAGWHVAEHRFLISWPPFFSILKWEEFLLISARMGILKPRIRESLLLLCFMYTSHNGVKHRTGDLNNSVVVVINPAVIHLTSLYLIRPFCSAGPSDMNTFLKFCLGTGPRQMHPVFFEEFD